MRNIFAGLRLDVAANFAGNDFTFTGWDVGTDLENKKFRFESTGKLSSNIEESIFHFFIFSTKKNINPLPLCNPWYIPSLECLCNVRRRCRSCWGRFGRLLWARRRTPGGEWSGIVDEALPSIQNGTGRKAQELKLNKLVFSGISTTCSIKMDPFKKSKLSDLISLI